MVASNGHPSQAIEQWLAAQEREEVAKLNEAERALLDAQRALDDQRVKVSLIRQWRSEVHHAPAEAAEQSPEDAPPVVAGSDRPDFSEVTDPTGRRGAIWDLLNEQRGRELDSATFHRELVRRGLIEPTTRLKAISITLRRMAEAGQIEKAGRGRYVLKPVTDDTANNGSASGFPAPKQLSAAVGPDEHVPVEGGGA